jgi:hypothetical protein
LQGASTQQERVVLATLDSNYLAKLPKPKKWREMGSIPRNRAFRFRYYQQVAHNLGWKERHVDGFLEVVRDTLRKVVWPDHGEEQRDMAAEHSQGIGEKRNLHIDASMERSAMAKGGESKTEGAQVSNQEMRVKDNNKDTTHIHKMMVRGKEANGREIEDCCEKKSIVTTNNASTIVNEQGQKKKATKAVDLQSSLKGQRDVNSQSGSKEFRFTKLIVQEHEVVVRVPKYVVSELEQLEVEEQNLDWILGMVQRSYIEEQSNAKMYDVLFADGIRNCIPSVFTEPILRHEKNSIQFTENVKPTCNISSDNESEDEDGSRDGDDSWPVESQDDHEQATE